MGKTPAVAALLLTTVFCAGASAQDARAVVDSAIKAMGMTGLTSITYAGVAAQGNFGQSRTISFGLASTSIRDYVADHRLHAAGVACHRRRRCRRRSRARPAPQPGTYEQTITPASPAWAQQLQIWVTPWGFLRGAAAANATVRSRKIDGVDVQGGDLEPGAEGAVRRSLPARRLHQRRQPGRARRDLGRASDPRRHARRVAATAAISSFDGVMVPARIAERHVGMEMFVAEIRRGSAPNPPDPGAR